LNDHDRIQPQQCEVGQIILAQPFSSEMGMNQAQSAKTARSGACASEVRDEELVGVPDDDMGELASPIDEQSKLPTQLPRELANAFAELGSDEAVGWISAPVQGQKCLRLALLQALGITMKRFDNRPRSGGDGKRIRRL
jgi:hypothetical protein